MVGCSSTGTTQGKASAPSTRAELESQATATLNRLYSAMPGTREQIARAKGVLICPAVIGGSFVVGAEHGKCVLRSNGTSRGYYSTTAASIGWQAGGQSKAVIYVFSTNDAYNKFVNSDGWSVGADATVAVGKAGANGSVDTDTINAPISSYVLTNAGLEAGVSVQGSKITKIQM
ncbi:MAG: YSC84-related protein [Comamonadaceae bacterium]|nr:YSC84-related protein [Comamonadaceae bacterium]